MEILRIEQLQKRFGKNEVIKDLTLQVPEGEIFGFIGQNGAGKTTTMKMILGLLPADAGTIHVCGEPVQFGETKTNEVIGYLPDVPEFYPYMTAMEYLKLCGDVTGLTSEKTKARSLELLGLAGLEVSKKKIGGYSRGMKQRLGIAQALLNQPKLLICDEPTSALDPVGRKEILDILLAVKSQTTVLFSTHILSDVERICDRVAVLHEGKIQLSGTLQELKAQHKAETLVLEFQTSHDCKLFADLLIDLLKEQIADLKCERNGSEAIIHTNNLANTQKQAMELLIREGILPIRMEALEPSIESLFLGVVS
jgi:ABC-2 type transport system ATP-binding protein